MDVQRVIHKYPIEGSKAELPLHEGAQCIAFQMHAGVATSWWIDDVKAPSVPVRVLVLGTGRGVPNGYVHAGTLQEGGFVWHLFREGTTERVSWLGWGGMGR